MSLRGRVAIVSGATGGIGTVTVRALDREMQPFEIEADGLLARCLQHEIDHLDGKLFIDALRAKAPNLEVIPIAQFDPDNATLKAAP